MAAMACSVQQKVADNARLSAASPAIPSNVSLMVQRQHTLVSEDIKANAEAILADGTAIRDECRASIAAYQEAQQAWQAHDYPKAVEDLQAIIDNTEDVLRAVGDMKTRGSTLRNLIVGPLPAVLASAAAIVYKMLHR